MNDKNIFTLREFLQEYRISKSTFYKLIKQKKAPVLIKLDGKILISKESAVNWQHAMENKG